MIEIEYKKIFDELQDIIPANWDEIIFYAEYTSDSYSYKYFVKLKGKYIDCFNIRGVTEDLLIQKFIKFNDIIRPSRVALPDKDKWSVMTMTIRNDGTFNVDFDYTDISENSIEYFQKWKAKYLK